MIWRYIVSTQKENFIIELIFISRILLQIQHAPHWKYYRDNWRTSSCNIKINLHSTIQQNFAMTALHCLVRIEVYVVYVAAVVYMYAYELF